MIRAAFFVLALGCGARTGLEVAPPTPADAGTDVGVDTGRDVGIDASVRCPFGIDDTITATIAMTTDDNYRLFVNGTLVDETPRLWSDPQRYSVPIFRHPSRRNVIAIEGINLFRIDGRDRGVLAQLTLDASGQRALVTDEAWRMSTVLPSGWTSVDFDAGAWPLAIVEGADGVAPWGNLLGSSARWLWSYDSSGLATDKPEEEHVAFRRDFFLDVDGPIRDTAGPCP